MLRSKYNPGDFVNKQGKKVEEYDDEFENCDLDDDEIEENPEGNQSLFATNQLNLTKYSNQNMSVR